MRELSDGRVLVTDPSEGRIVVIDMRSGSVLRIGRIGRGPSEYQLLGPLFSLAGDSSLMADFSQHRWLLFSGPSIVATLPPDTPIIKAIKVMAKGADALGNVWIAVSPREMGSAPAGTVTFGPADSDFVVRGNRLTAKLDTVTQVRVAPSRRTVSINSRGGRGFTMGYPPLSVGEEAVLFADGWFAVARLDPYRVDWISPDGQVVYGNPIQVTPIKVTTAEKEAYHARRAGWAEFPAMLPQSFKDRIRLARQAVRDQWPAEFPPFAKGLIAGGEGNLWLRHPVSMNYLNNRYDIVDRRGRRLGVVALGNRERIVTVSRTSVYVAWKDSDDIERLRRHPLPLYPR
ncbi:MAG TPA: hypothetical protein VJ817_17220 [Gemmatimonadales bacterium]|nr:hypothetical protein [Gemmatimonadales bacterium]